jgi:hypothetical protein
MMLWSLLLPALKRMIPLRRLVALLAGTGRGRAEASWPRIVRWSAALTKLRPRSRSNCLDRSLLAYRFLTRAGAEPHLVLAVTQAAEGVAGHAWVTVSGEPIHEPAASVTRFTQILEFDSHGHAVAQAPAGAMPTIWE